MGAAKILKGKAGFSNRTFTIIGTPHYMAPEILTGKGYTMLVDLWSVGKNFIIYIPKLILKYFKEYVYMSLCVVWFLLGNKLMILMKFMKKLSKRKLNILVILKIEKLEN